jgi:hypothetical protein
MFSEQPNSFLAIHRRWLDIIRLGHEDCALGSRSTTHLLRHIRIEVLDEVPKIGPTTLNLILLEPSHMWRETVALRPGRKEHRIRDRATQPRQLGQPIGRPFRKRFGLPICRMKKLMRVKAALIRTFMNVGVNIQRPAAPGLRTRPLPATAGVVDRQPLARLLIKFREDIDGMAVVLHTEQVPSDGHVRVQHETVAPLRERDRVVQLCRLIGQDGRPVLPCKWIHPPGGVLVNRYPRGRAMPPNFGMCDQIRAWSSYRWIAMFLPSSLMIGELADPLPADLAFRISKLSISAALVGSRFLVLLVSASYQAKN